MSLSIVMPVYNEEEVIAETVKAYYSEIISKIENSEFIVIDDCSDDNTYNILKELKLRFSKLKVLRAPVNSGHGKAIRKGYNFASKKHIFQVDSDNQFNANDFWKLYALKDRYDLILGFRKKRHDPIVRLLLTRIIRVFNFIVFRVWIKDANCPFRLIKKDVLDKILSLIDEEALAPNIMITVIAKKKKIKMAEVPITHQKRETGTCSIAKWKLIKFAFKGFMQLLGIKNSID